MFFFLWNTTHCVVLNSLELMRRLHLTSLKEQQPNLCHNCLQIVLGVSQCHHTILPVLVDQCVNDTNMFQIVLVEIQIGKSYLVLLVGWLDRELHLEDWEVINRANEWNFLFSFCW